MGFSNKVHFSKTAFSFFVFSNEVNIFCNLRICMSRSCAFSNCTAETKRNKRHESVGDLAEVETVTTKLRFRRQAKLPSLSATVILKIFKIS